MEDLEHKSRVQYTCGHSGNDVLGNLIDVKSITRENNRCVDTMTVCDNCLVWYRKNNLIIDNDEQKERWLKTHTIVTHNQNSNFFDGLDKLRLNVEGVIIKTLAQSCKLPNLKTINFFRFSLFISIIQKYL